MIKKPEYFAAIVEAGSLTRAAKQLYVSQSYLSQYVKQLEASLDTELFDHASSPLQLTHAGRIYYRYMLRSIQLSENLKKELQDSKNQDSGVLRIGLPGWRASCTLPVIYPDFCRKFPNIHLALTEASPKSLTDALMCGSLDLVIMNLGSLPSALFSEKLEYQELFTEQLLLAAPSGHPAVREFLTAKEPPSSPLTLLNHIPLITTRASKPFPANRDLLFHRYKVEPEILLETGSFTTALNLVATGIACAFTMSGNAGTPGLLEYVTYFPIESPENANTVAIFYQKNSYLSRIARLFIQSSRESFQDFSKVSHD